MPRRYGRKKHRSRAKFSLPVAIVAPAAAMALDIGKAAMAGNVNYIKGTYTGVWENGQFNAGQVINTYAPLAAGAVIHMAASKFGVNRALARAKIPLLRV